MLLQRIRVLLRGSLHLTQRSYVLLDLSYNSSFWVYDDWCPWVSHTRVPHHSHPHQPMPAPCDTKHPSISGRETQARHPTKPCIIHHTQHIPAPTGIPPCIPTYPHIDQKAEKETPQIHNLYANASVSCCSVCSSYDGASVG